jgi:prepilin-type processing-associated H-X9-DG protein
MFIAPSQMLLNPGWSSYAVSTGSAYSHFVNAADPEYYNGAIILQTKGTTSIRKINNLDGTSHTFLAGEVNYLVSYASDAQIDADDEFPGGPVWWWNYPFHCQASTAGVFNTQSLLTPRDADTFRSDHSGGVNMLLVDGSTRFVDDLINADVLNWLADRRDGNVIQGF